MIEPIDIFDLVRRLSARTGLTQEKFAAKLGVTFPTINRWENRRMRPSPLAMHQIEQLAHELGEDTHALPSVAVQGPKAWVQGDRGSP
jgi:putative transcriptional regulator